jgi:hypothetical protein
MRNSVKFIIDRSTITEWKTLVFKAKKRGHSSDTRKAKKQVNDGGRGVLPTPMNFFEPIP